MAVFSTIVESFSGSMNSSVWTTTSGPYTTVAHVNGALQFNTTTTSAYATYETLTTHDLTGSYVCVEVVDPGNQTLTSLEAIPIHLVKDASNSISMTISGGYLRAYKKVAGTITELISSTYNNSTMRFVRIREAGGQTFWEYSSTRSRWTTMLGTSSPIAVTALKLELKAGTYANEASASAIKFDNVNYFSKILYGTLTSYVDTNGVWTNPFNAADVDITTGGPALTTYAESSTTGSTSTNSLVLSNPNVMNSYSNIITSLRVRILGEARAAGNYLYADISGGGSSPTLFVFGNGMQWSAWSSVTAPSGGWTTANLANLKATCYLSGSGTTNTGKVYAVQIEYTVITDKISTFSDKFIGTTVDSTQWVLSNSAGSSYQNNLVYLYQGGGTSGFAELRSKYMYDLSGSSFYFQAKADQAAPGYLDFSQNGKMYIAIGSGSIGLWAGSTILFSYAPGNNNPLYIRIRESAGVLYMDTSTDNITYLNRGSVTLSTYGIDFVANPMKLWFYVWNGGVL